MIHTAKNDSAVSPVIGTILLVAISVVLIAIILAVVMGFGGDTNEKKVGLNAKPETGNNATLILYGGASIPELVKLEMIDQDSANGSYVKLWEKTSGDSDVFVGLPYLAEDVAQPEKDMDIYDTRINVRGTFSDGTNVILLVQPMTFFDVEGPKVPPTPSNVAKYIEKVIYDGTDITDDHGQITTGFTVPAHPTRHYENPVIAGQVGIYIGGKKISYQLTDPFPSEANKITIEFWWGYSPLTISGGSGEQKTATDLVSGEIREFAMQPTYSGHGSGIGGISPAYWGIKITVKDANNNVLAYDTWQIEVTAMDIPEPPEGWVQPIIP